MANKTDGYNFYVTQGDTFSKQITVSSGGNPFNLTGLSFYFVAKVNPSDSDHDAVIYKAVTTFSTPSSGVFTFTLDPSDTDIPVGIYYLTMKIVLPDGETYTVWPIDPDTYAYLYIN